MTIQIIGSGCPNCRKLEANAREAAQNLNLEADFEKVQDPDAMMEMGIMMTPGLAVDGEVKKTGKVLTVSEIEAILSET